MEEQDVEYQNAYCYACHREIGDDLHMLANRRYIYMFHKRCLEGYLEHFKTTEPVIQLAC